MNSKATRRLLLPVLLLAATTASAETRRIAIVVGNNAGTGEMPPLRYAESDAGKMARVLVELGDVQAEDVMLLQGQKVGSVERAITEARDRIAFFKRSPDVRTVVFFYFSGHSDGEAIELSAHPQQEFLVELELGPMRFGNGHYVVTVAIYRTLDLTGATPSPFYDLLDRSFTFAVTGHAPLVDGVVVESRPWRLIAAPPSSN